MLIKILKFLGGLKIKKYPETFFINSYSSIILFTPNLLLSITNKKTLVNQGFESSVGEI